MVSTNTLPAIRKIASSKIDWLPYALIPDTYFRVLHVDEENNIVLLNFKMPAHTVTPMHGHHCNATAYTLEGEWLYDDLVFRKGDIAYEGPDEVHQPVTADRSAMLLTTLIGGPGNDKLLEDHNTDGTRTLLRTRFFKAFERLPRSEYEKVDLESLLD